MRFGPSAKFHSSLPLDRTHCPGGCVATKGCHDVLDMPAFPLVLGNSLYKLGGKATLLGVAGTWAWQSCPFLSRSDGNQAIYCLPVPY